MSAGIGQLYKHQYIWKELSICIPAKIIQEIYQRSSGDRKGKGRASNKDTKDDSEEVPKASGADNEGNLIDA